MNKINTTKNMFGLTFGRNKQNKELQYTFFFKEKALSSSKSTLGAFLNVKQTDSYIQLKKHSLSLQSCFVKFWSSAIMVIQFFTISYLYRSVQIFKYFHQDKFGVGF